MLLEEWKPLVGNNVFEVLATYNYLSIVVLVLVLVDGRRLNVARVVELAMLRLFLGKWLSLRRNFLLRGLSRRRFVRSCSFLVHSSFGLRGVVCSSLLFFSAATKTHRTVTLNVNHFSPLRTKMLEF